MAQFKPSASWMKEMQTPKTKMWRQAVKQALSARGNHLERNRRIPVIPKCPSPTCECAEMPPDLDIDTSKTLNGTMAAYSEQIIVSTGQADWKSRIEDEKDTAPWGSLISQIKSMLGPKGRFHDPYRNVVVSASSFTSADLSSKTPTEAILFPSFSLVKRIDPSESTVSQFLQSFILSKPLKSTTETVRDPTSESQWLGEVHPISTPTIFICSHHSRDVRCGVLGPLLHAEFVQYLNKRPTLRNQAISDLVTQPGQEEQGVMSYASHPAFQPNTVNVDKGQQHPINVGMISHVGGHKWAGNVIVYIPPDYRINALDRPSHGAKPKDAMAPEQQALPQEGEEAGLSPLAGKGIWYGRVEPKHVEGIVEQTIGHGNIIKELFRGGVNRDGSTLRIE